MTARDLEIDSLAGCDGEEQQQEHECGVLWPERASTRRRRGGDGSDEMLLPPPQARRKLPGDGDAGGASSSMETAVRALRSLSELRTDRRALEPGVPTEVSARVSATRKKVMAAIEDRKSEIVRQLDEHYADLKGRLVNEIRDAESQLAALQKADARIDDNVAKQLDALSQMANAELTATEHACMSAASAAAQLYTKEKHLLLASFQQALDALQ